MNRTSNTPARRAMSRKKRLSVALLIAVVLAVSFALRTSTGPEAANAELPFRFLSSKKKTSHSTENADNRRSPASRRPAANMAERNRNKYVALVNNEPIRREELAKACLRRFGEEVLESEINKHLIQQACQRANIRITDADLDKEIKRMAGKFGLSVEAYLSAFQRERNFSPEQYRNDMIWPMVALRRLAADKLTVSNEELAKAFETEFGPKVQVRVIAANTRQKAESLHAQAIANPREFPTLAKNESDDATSAAIGGLIYPISRHVGNPDIEKAVFSLKEGEISDIVHAQGQYFIFRCDRRIAPVQPRDKRQVAEKLTEQIRNDKLREASAELFQELQANARIVNVFNNPRLRKSQQSIAATVNGKPISLRQLMDQSLVRKGMEVLEGEINRKILAQALKSRNLTITREDIYAEIDRAAKSFGFVNADGSINRNEWLEEVTKNQDLTPSLYQKDVVWPTVALKKLVEAEIKITEEDLQKAFQANYGERVRVLAVVLNDRYRANQVWEKARDIQSVDFFGQLAHEYSIEPVSSANYGEVPPIAKHGGRPMIEEEAFLLSDDNPLSGILTIGDKFVILRYLGRTEPEIEDPNDPRVRAELLEHVREEKFRVAMADEFDKLKQSAEVLNFLSDSRQSNHVATAGHKKELSGRKPVTSRQARAPARSSRGSTRQSRVPTVSR